MIYSSMSPEEKKAYSSRVREYRAANPEKVKTWTKTYRQTEKYKDSARKQARKQRLKNPERVLNIALKSGRKKLPVPTRPCPAVCELCGNPPTRRVLHLDHDHITNTFRGWLCQKCNTNLGRFGDDIKGLQAAIMYMRRNQAPLLPTDAQERKKIPIASGFFDYFPNAIIEIAKVSYAGNQQHNFGQPLHWARGKSTDQVDTMLRHLAERGEIDTDGQRHSAKMCWRALAILQLEMEAAGAPIARGAK
jgi:hypothetical protein